MRRSPHSFTAHRIKWVEFPPLKALLGVAMGFFLLLSCLSFAEATLRIKVAEVQDGVAFVKGAGAAKQSPIAWESAYVTSANPGGAFSFTGVVPADCVGTLSDGTETIEVAVGNCTPVSGPPAPVPQIGQTATASPGDDGALQKGVPLPTPRFTDNANGTVTDNLTGLIWLKNANCPGTTRDWQTALSDVASLNASGTMNGNDCGDTSAAGTHQTDWRLPNIRELSSLVNFAYYNPCLSNTAGTGQHSENDPFTQVPTGYWANYFSSTSEGGTWVFGLKLEDCTVQLFHPTESPSGLPPGYVLAVRGGS